jgi:opacity protein-like surface antigen
MKKSTIILAALFMSGSVAAAQEAETPEAGSFTTEVAFAPFSNEPFGLINGLRGRFFLSDEFAIRADLELGYASSSDHHFINNNADEEIAKDSRFIFGISPGVEYHFAIYERVSLYAGAAIGVGFFKASRKETSTEQGAQEVEISGANANDDRSGLMFGVQAFSGIDVYVYKNLYLGTELGLQYGMVKPFEVETTIGSTTTTNKDYTLSSTLEFYILPAFRVGWKF